MGIDNGGGFLKMSLGIMSSDTSESETSTSSKNLLHQNCSKASGINQQLLVTICKNLPETYDCQNFDESCACR